MKKILFAVLFATGLMVGAQAQSSAKQKLKAEEVPAALKSSFNAEFPNAKDVEWSIKEGKYKVEFELNDQDHFAKYDASGKRMAKGMQIKQNELPPAVMAAVKKDHANKEIDDVYKVEKDGATQYLVVFDEDIKVKYSEDGQVINEK
jgi:Protein of unknown function (DUF2874).